MQDILDITQWREDTNFMIDWQEQSLKIYNEIFFLPREHKMHIFERKCNVLFIWHTDNSFDIFPKISDHFPKIVEKLVRRSHKRCPSVSEHFRRLPKIAEYFREEFGDLSIIDRRI